MRYKSIIFTVVLLACSFAYSAAKMSLAPLSINETTVSTSYGSLSQPLVNQVPAPAGCYYQNVQCLKAPCNPVLICTSPKPSATCKPRPACLDATPRCMIAETEDMCAPPTKPTPSPKPFVSPTPISVGTGIATFKATTSCGSTSFLSISFTCKDGRSKEISSNTCTDFVSALSTAQETCGKEIK